MERSPSNHLSTNLSPDTPSMDRKKATVVSNTASGGKGKQTPPPAKGKSVTKQASIPTSSTSSSICTTTITQYSSGTTNSFQDYILFWLDSNIDMENDEYRNIITQLQSVVNTIHVFNDGNECLKFLSTINDQKVFIVVSGSLGQSILPRIHNVPQLHTVFIYCGNKSHHESWVKSWPKIQGIFTDIASLREQLQQTTRQYDEALIDMSFISLKALSSDDLNQLDQSFMYTKLIKDILLQLEYTEQNVKDLVTYCIAKHSGNLPELSHIQRFQIEYSKESTIEWYTRECFLYPMLNHALRNQEFDVIIMMGFFICNLHSHIDQRHSKQVKNLPKRLELYRGQSMLPEKFKELQNTKGGLLSFNNFLSTSKSPAAAMLFVDRILKEAEKVAVMFIIDVNSAVSSTPFADISDISKFGDEQEVLFSMLSVFRINDVKQAGSNKRYWEVHLTLIGDGDEQLNILTERMREEIEGPSAFYRLGALMIKLGQFKKAEEVFDQLRQNTSDELEKGHIYYQLGQIKDNLGQSKEALDFYQKALTIYEDNLSSNHPNIATCYNNIGLVYDNANDYSKALPYYQEALRIYKETLPENHPNIATSYNSIGMIYNSTGDYHNAFSYCKAALDIYVKELPKNHPLLATGYNNVGLVCANMKKQSDAVSYYTQAVEIGRSALPKDHPTLRVYLKNLASVSKKGGK